MRLYCIVIVAACVLAATIFPAAAQRKQAAEGDPDQLEMTAFSLDMERLNRFAAASKAMISAGQERAMAEDGDRLESDQKSISGTVRAIERHPALVTAITNAGMTTREYVVTGMTLMTTAIAVGMKRQGSLAMKEIPPSVSKENAAFVEQNYAKIETLMKSMQAKEQ